MTPQPRAAVLAIAAYVGGGSTLPGANRTIKLSSNEAPFGPPPAAREAFLRVATEQHRYPDGGIRSASSAAPAPTS
jgi:histidinol-phosphate aminotransferase